MICEECELNGTLDCEGRDLCRKYLEFVEEQLRVEYSELAYHIDVD
jgi:hypothetical protein